MQKNDLDPHLSLCTKTNPERMKEVSARPETLGDQEKCTSRHVHGRWLSEQSPGSWRNSSKDWQAGRHQLKHFCVGKQTPLASCSFGRRLKSGICKGLRGVNPERINHPQSANGQASWTVTFQRVSTWRNALIVTCSPPGLQTKTTWIQSHCSQKNPSKLERIRA